jgi:hypothetical protein
MWAYICKGYVGLNMSYVGLRKCYVGLDKP